MRGHLIYGFLIFAMLHMICKSHHLRNIITNPYWPEYYHYPGLYTPWLDAWVGTGTWVPHRNYTPDFRLAEPYYTVYSAIFFREYNRPYRLSPQYKQAYWYDWNEKMHLVACYCCTAYRRYHILASCAVITQRHILTTATSTDVVLRNYNPAPTLQHILGIYYENIEDVLNGTQYHPGPSRIHYHPLYKRDYQCNVSHPIPCVFDLAVWTTYFNLGRWNWPRISVCQRGGSTWSKYAHTTPYGAGDRHFVIGYLFMKAFGRRPLPSFRYGVRVNYYIVPCPKVQWQWFHCVQGNWARLGMDSGGALHLMDLGSTGREDGLTGICAFSMKLRSKDIVHYYTVVDNHPVLDFLSDAYNGYLPYEFLDSRFLDTKGSSPRLYMGHYIPVYYNSCFQPVNYYPPNYRR